MKLGLIGDNIKPSRSPLLHRLAGQLCGLTVSYDLLIPAEMAMDFDQVLNYCLETGYTGVNVTYPYKELAAARADVEDQLVRRIGSLNTLVFHEGRIRGFNTDYTGFIEAFSSHFSTMMPGAVAMIGAGGAGKAVAFGLLTLHASEIRIFDHVAAKAEALASSLREASGGKVPVSCHADVAAAINGATGVVNCTPVGMVGNPGTPVPRHLLRQCNWAFEAVYTPIQTQFKIDAEESGLDVLGGYELFFNQGVRAFRIFTGHEPANLVQLREMLTKAA